MIAARIRLALTAVLFAAWIGWLAYAVSQHGRVQIVSRAQLTAAPLWVVAEVELDASGLPRSTVRLKQTLRGNTAGMLEVRNLPKAVTPLPIAGGSRTPPAGDYLLALDYSGDGAYLIAGLPRSPGYHPTMPDRPIIYPWTADVQRQVTAWR